MAFKVQCSLVQSENKKDEKDEKERVLGGIMKVRGYVEEDKKVSTGVSLDKIEL